MPQTITLSGILDSESKKFDLCCEPDGQLMSGLRRQLRDMLVQWIGQQTGWQLSTQVLTDKI